MKKPRKNLQAFEDMLQESLRFHGLLTPSSDQDANLEDVKLPEHLNESDFLLEKSKEKENLELPRIKMAAFKSSGRKKKL
jgi:hypothetical protein